MLGGSLEENHSWVLGAALWLCWEVKFLALQPPWCQGWGRHGWMLLRWDRWTPLQCASAMLCPPSVPFRAGPSYGNQRAKQETARLPPGNFSWERGPRRQGISPSPSSPRCLPK